MDFCLDIRGVYPAEACCGGRRGSRRPPVSYFKDVAPIVREHCAGCHQLSVKQGDLSLTNYEAFMQGGAKGKVIQPGQPEHSLVIGYLMGEQKPQMPFGQTPQNLDLILVNFQA
jgi:hypothetical protein